LINTNSTTVPDSHSNKFVLFIFTTIHFLEQSQTQHCKLEINRNRTYKKMKAEVKVLLYFSS